MILMVNFFFRIWIFLDTPTFYVWKFFCGGGRQKKKKKWKILKLPLGKTISIPKKISIKNKKKVKRIKRCVQQDSNPRASLRSTRHYRVYQWCIKSVISSYVTIFLYKLWLNTPTFWATKKKFEKKSFCYLLFDNDFFGKFFL